MTGQHRSAKMSRQELRSLADFREMAEAHLERLGAAIMRERKERHWSRARLGREVDAHEKTVERWEKAQTAGALDNLEAIAGAFEMDADTLLAEATAPQTRGGPVPDIIGAMGAEQTTHQVRDQLDRIEAKLDDLLRMLSDPKPVGGEELPPVGRPV